MWARPSGVRSGATSTSAPATPPARWPAPPSSRPVFRAASQGALPRQKPHQRKPPRRRRRSNEPRGRQSGRRPMTPDEAELWDRLGQSVDKVKNKPRVTPHDNTTCPAGRRPGRKLRRSPSSSALAAVRRQGRAAGPQAAPFRLWRTSIAATSVRWPPARSASMHISTCTACGCATPAPSCTPFYSPASKVAQDRARRYRQGRGIGQPRSSGGRLESRAAACFAAGTAMVGGARAAYRGTQFHLGRRAPWR